MGISVEESRRVIQGLWVLIIAYWFLRAYGNKKTVRQETAIQRFRYLMIPFLVGIVIGNSSALHRHFYEVTQAIAQAGVLLVAAGIGIAIWARVTLGRNWSGSVTLKEGHTLITQGPYRFVRHPIYTGLLLAVLGTVMVFAPSSAGVGYVLLVAISFGIKLRYEEQLMMNQFPNEYPAYRQQVRTAFVPLIW